MNSLRRPYHIRAHDLRPYTRSYDPNSGNTPETWVQNACTGLQPGSLVFLLEPVGSSFGLTSFARKEESENFRVSELAIVTRIENQKPTVLNITSNNYEMRFLSTLLEEKIRKALLDNKKLCFISAQPAAQLTTTTVNEIERLSSVYASGGSRRDFVGEQTETEQEPLTAILSACGITLQLPDSNKQAVDPGYICHLLFAPETRQQDDNRSQLKGKFVLTQQYINSNSSIEIADNPTESKEESFDILNSWDPTGNAHESGDSSSLFKRLTDELAKKKAQPENSFSAPEINAPNLNRNATALPIETEQKTASPTSEQVETSTGTKEVFQHITQAISGLLEAPADLSGPQVTHQPVTELRTEQSVDRAIDSISPANMETELEAESIAPPDFAIIDSVTELASAQDTETMPAKLDDFQEPKVVISEMASLVNKLESQVARAAKKLTTKAKSIEQQLTDGISSLTAKISQENKDMEAELLVEGNSLYNQFESLFENLKLEIAERAALARQQIQKKSSGQQNLIEEDQKKHHQALTAALNENQAQFAQLVNEQETKLKTIVETEAENLDRKLTGMHDLLQEKTSKFIENLSSQVNSFEKRIDEELASVLNNLESSTALLSKNIDISCQHSLEKSKKTRDEFESNLKHLIEVTEITLARQIRAAQVEYFLPRLKEHKQLIETMMQDMEETFAEKLIGQSQAQLNGLVNSLVTAKTQLKSLVDECLAKLDVIGRNQESGLEGLFTNAAKSLEESTTSLLRMLKEAEQEITSSDAVCKKLAETYSLDNDPAVTSLRQNIYSRVDNLKAQVKNELESAVNSDCATLEELIRNQHGKLNERRAELAQRVRFASDNGLQRIRAAIHDAFTAIQTEREKYME